MGYIGNGPYQGVLTGGNIQDGSVEEADIANDAVTTQKIEDFNITEGKLATGAVTTGKIANYAVTDAKLGSSSVTTGKIADGAVTAAKIAAGAAVPTQSGHSGKYLTTDGTNASWGTITQETASSILTKVKTVDGSGSGLDADLLDGLHQSSFLRASINSSDHQTGDFAIGTDGSRNFIQSHSSHPLDINPLGNAVTIGGTSNTAWHAGNDGSGSGLDADLLDGQQGSYYLAASSAANFRGINSEYTGSVSATGWYTIAEFGNGRAQGEFHLWDQDSSRHNYVKINVIWSYGHGGITCTANGKHGLTTISHARLMYNTSDQTYGGCKLQIYCPNPSWTLRVRQVPSQFSGFIGFTQTTIAKADSVTGFAEYSRASNLDLNGGFSTSGSNWYAGGNKVWHEGNASGKVLQQVVKRSTTLASLNTTTYTEPHSDYRVVITPKSASSRIHIRYCIPVNPSGATNVIMHTRAWKFGPSSVALTSDGGTFGGNIGSRSTATAPFRPYGYDGNDPDTWMFEAYDDPGSTAMQQYGFLYKRETGGSNTVYFGHSAGNTSSYGWMAPIIIIATEIA